MFRQSCASLFVTIFMELVEETRKYVIEAWLSAKIFTYYMNSFWESWAVSASFLISKTYAWKMYDSLLFGLGKYLHGCPDSQFHFWDFCEDFLLYLQSLSKIFVLSKFCNLATLETHYILHSASIQLSWYLYARVFVCVGVCALCSRGIASIIYGDGGGGGDGGVGDCTTMYKSSRAVYIRAQYEGTLALYMWIAYILEYVYVCTYTYPSRYL